MHNLAVNSYIERVEELRATARSLRELLPKSAEILGHFSRLTANDRVTGFAEQQVKEETLKACLILNQTGWTARHHSRGGCLGLAGQLKQALANYSGSASTIGFKRRRLRRAISQRHRNPAKEAQATDRVYRIGQARDVQVHVPILLRPERASYDVNLDKLLRSKMRCKMRSRSPRPRRL